MKVKLEDRFIIFDIDGKKSYLTLNGANKLLDELKEIVIKLRSIEITNASNKKTEIINLDSLSKL